MVLWSNLSPMSPLSPLPISFMIDFCISNGIILPKIGDKPSKCGDKLHFHEKCCAHRNYRRQILYLVHKHEKIALKIVYN